MTHDDILSLYPRPSRSGPYFARSASDRDPNWPFWYVAGPNRKTNYLTDLGDIDNRRRGLSIILPDKATAEMIAAAWNAPPARR